ncbi:hypothetical protein ACFV24_09335 [Nocardia fluminea]|uniref:hypothetical protein n=1 Tax=Nocardia fluminea TaxID=134984 RepID=UPI0033ECB4DA
MRRVGDYFERIVDLDVAAADAQASAERMIDWMVSRGWLLRETSGEAMYSLHVDEGYVAGPAWAEIARGGDVDRMPAPVAVVVGRNAHYGGQGEIAPADAKCPSCGATTVIIDYPQAWEADPAVWQPFSDAIDAWRDSGAGAVTCTSCDTTSPITDWRWPWGFALGTLAFDFWGWPPLTDEFVAEFTARLGHRVDHHTGKF